MHARRLQSELEEADYLGDEYFRGKIHHKLSAAFNTGEKFTYFIDNESGLIRKAFRNHPRADLVYVFSNHQNADGLTYASDMNFFVNGELRLTSVLRGLELNPDIKEAFSQFDSFKPWGKTIDSSEMKVRQVADGIYQAGMRRSETVFIEQQDHYIAVGGANALVANFEQVKKYAKNDKPLKYYVLTHHHRSNLNGLNNALDLGATLVMSKEHQATVEKIAYRSIFG